MGDCVNNKTKELIDALMAVAFGYKDLESQRVRLHNLCVDADKETLELEADAELGRAVMLAFEEDVDGIQFIRRISTVEKLLEWAEGVE